MSLVFSNAASKSGIVELIDRTLGTDSNSYPIAEKVSDINLAMDAALAIIFKAAGRWNFDDNNQTDLPFITTNLVQGQRSYSFDVDGSGNVIIDIDRVFVKTQSLNGQSGIYQEATPVDLQTEDGLESMTSGLDVQGVPYRFDKTGNNILLDPVPSYSEPAGLKMFIKREGIYFTVSDTTKKPGFAGLFHEYLVLRPSYQYARRESLALAGGVLRNGSITGLLREVSEMETSISNWYGSRSPNERAIIQPRITPFK